MGIRWHELRPSLHVNEVALFLVVVRGTARATSRICGSSCCIMCMCVHGVCSPFMHGVRTRTSCAATAATQAQAAESYPAPLQMVILASVVVFSHLRAIPNSDLYENSGVRTLAEVKFRFLAFGSSMVWVGPSMTHLLWCHMSYFTSSSSSSSTDFPRGQDTCSAGPRMQRG